jgi:hypothetical protein
VHQRNRTIRDLVSKPHDCLSSGRPCRLAPPGARLPSGSGRELGGIGLGFSRQDTDSDRALRNLVERDRMLTDIVPAETARLMVPAIEVNSTMTEDDLARRVTKVFGL